MAIDPSTSRRPIAGDLPPDENVVSSYRAISTAAIASLICGVASILTFLWPYFAILGALAIVFGVLALRAIRRLPEALTGERLANIGIGTGLLFSLAALTIGLVQTWMIEREATRFAKSYVEALRGKSIEDVVFLQNNPAYRKGKTPVEAMDEMKKQMPRSGQFEMEVQAPRGMIDRLASGPGQTVELGKITGRQISTEDVSYIEYLLIFKGPKSERFPEVQYGTVQLTGFPEGRSHAWKAASAKFPIAEPPGGF